MWSERTKPFNFTMTYVVQLFNLIQPNLLLIDLPDKKRGKEK